MTDTTTPPTGANGEALPALSDDILVGAKAIATFVYGDANAKNTRRAYHAADKLGMPTFRLGATLCARRSTIMKWIAKQEAA